MDRIGPDQNYLFYYLGEGEARSIQPTPQASLFDEKFNQQLALPGPLISVLSEKDKDRCRRNAVLASTIAGTEYEGLSPLILSMYWDAIPKNQNSIHGYSQQEKQAVAKVCDDVSSLLKFFMMSNQFMEEVDRRIDKDRVCYIPFVIYGMPGHFLTLRAEKSRDGYRLYFLNEGAAAELHQTALERKNRFLIDMRSAEFNISRDQFLRFLQKAYILEENSSDATDTFQTNFIYHLLGKYASSVDFLPIDPYYSTTFQRVPNCTQASFQAAFADALRLVHPQCSREERKVLMLKLKDEAIFDWYKIFINKQMVNLKLSELKDLKRALQYQANRIKKLKGVLPTDQYNQMSFRLTLMRDHLRGLRKTLEAQNARTFSLALIPHKPSPRPPFREYFGDITSSLILPKRSKFDNLIYNNSLNVLVEEGSNGLITHGLICMKFLQAQKQIDRNNGDYKAALKGFRELIASINSNIQFPEDVASILRTEIGITNWHLYKLAKDNLQGLISQFFRDSETVPYLAFDPNWNSLSDFPITRADLLTEMISETRSDGPDALFPKEFNVDKYFRGSIRSTQLDRFVSFVLWLTDHQNSEINPKQTFLSAMGSVKAYQLYDYLTARDAVLKGYMNYPDEFEYLKFLFYYKKKPSPKEVHQFETVPFYGRVFKDTGETIYRMGMQPLKKEKSVEENIWLTNYLCETKDRIGFPQFLLGHQQSVTAGLQWATQNLQILFSFYNKESFKSWVEHTIFIPPNFIAALKAEPDLMFDLIHAFMKKGLALTLENQSDSKDRIWILRMCGEFEQYVRETVNRALDLDESIPKLYEKAFIAADKDWERVKIACNWLEYYNRQRSPITIDQISYILLILHVAKEPHEPATDSFNAVVLNFILGHLSNLVTTLSSVDPTPIIHDLFRLLNADSSLYSHLQFRFDLESFFFLSEKSESVFRLGGRVCLLGQPLFSSIEVTKQLNFNKFKVPKDQYPTTLLPDGFYYSNDQTWRFQLSSAGEVQVCMIFFGNSWFQLGKMPNWLSKKFEGDIPHKFIEPSKVVLGINISDPDDLVVFDQETFRPFYKIDSDSRIFLYENNRITSQEVVTEGLSESLTDWVNSLAFPPQRLCIAINGVLTRIELLSWQLSFSVKSVGHRQVLLCDTAPYQGFTVDNFQHSSFEDPGPMITMTNKKGQRIMLLGAYELQATTERLRFASAFSNLFDPKVPFYEYLDVEKGEPFTCAPLAALYISLKHYVEKNYQLAYDYLHQVRKTSDFDEKLLILMPNIGKWHTDSSAEAVLYRYHFLKVQIEILNMVDPNAFESKKKALKAQDENDPDSIYMQLGTAARDLGLYESESDDLMIYAEKMRLDLDTGSRFQSQKFNAQGRTEYSPRQENYSYSATNELMYAFLLSAEINRETADSAFYQIRTNLLKGEGNLFDLIAMRILQSYKEIPVLQRNPVIYLDDGFSTSSRLSIPQERDLTLGQSPTLRTFSKELLALSNDLLSSDIKIAYDALITFQMALINHFRGDNKLNSDVFFVLALFAIRDKHLNRKFTSLKELYECFPQEIDLRNIEILNVPNHFDAAPPKPYASYSPSDKTVLFTPSPKLSFTSRGSSEVVMPIFTKFFAPETRTRSTVRTPIRPAPKIAKAAKKSFFGKITDSLKGKPTWDPNKSVAHIIRNEKTEAQKILNRSVKMAKPKDHNIDPLLLRESLHQGIKQAEAEKEKVKQKILDLCHKKPHGMSADEVLGSVGKQSHQIKWDEILQAFISSDPAPILKLHPYLDKNDLNIIFSDILVFLSLEHSCKIMAQAATRCKIASKLDGIARDSELTDIGSLLNIQRVFDPTKFPLLLYLEATNGITLRQDQFDAILWGIEAIKLRDKQKIAKLLQAFAGFGKTTVFTLLLAFMSKKSGAIPVVFQIAQLYDRGKDELENALYDTFLFNLDAFNIRINQVLDENALKGIWSYLNKLKKKNTVLFMQPVAWHRLNLELKNCASDYSNETNQRKIEYLEAIINLIEEDGFNFYDEAHIIFGSTQDTTMGGGLAQSISPEIIDVLLLIYEVLRNSDIDLQNNRQAYASPDKLETAKKEIANRVINQFFSNLKVNRQALLGLFLGPRNIPIPSWLETLGYSTEPADLRAHSQIVAVYYYLSVLLPVCMSKQFEVDYGISDKPYEFFAVPKSKKCSVGAHYKKSIVAAAFTIQMIHQRFARDGMTPKNFDKLLTLALDQNFACKGKSPIFQKINQVITAYELPLQPILNFSWIVSRDEETQKRYWAHLKSIPEMADLYCAYVALPGIRSSEYSITSNPTDLLMKTNGLLLTATKLLLPSFPFPLTYMQNSDTHKLDVASEVETIETLMDPRNADVQSIPAIGSPTEFFDRIAQKNPQEFSSFAHLVDGGKIFDLTAEKDVVLGYLATFRRLYPNQPKCVIYTRADDSGKRRDFVLYFDGQQTHDRQLHSSNLTAQFKKLQIPSDLLLSRFTFYSIQETTGKDWRLPVNTKGIFTVGPGHGISEAIQNFKRDRDGLKPHKSIRFVLFDEIAASIPKSQQIPTNEEIVDWMIENEIAQMKQVIVLRFQQGVDAILSSFILVSHNNMAHYGKFFCKPTSDSLLAEAFQTRNRPHTFTDYVTMECKRLGIWFGNYNSLGQKYSQMLTHLIQETSELMGTDHYSPVVLETAEQLMSQTVSQVSQQQQTTTNTSFFGTSISTIPVTSSLSLDSPPSVWAKNGLADQFSLLPKKIQSILETSCVFTPAYLRLNNKFHISRPTPFILVYFDASMKATLLPMTITDWDKIAELKRTDSPNYVIVGNTVPRTVVRNYSNLSLAEINASLQSLEFRVHAALVLYLTEQLIEDDEAFKELLKGLDKEEVVAFIRFAGKYSYKLPVDRIAEKSILSKFL